MEKDIYLKLMEIQQNLKAPKNQYNSFGKYSYRNCEDILESLKPLLKEQKCVLLLNDEIIEVGGENYVKATVTLQDAESSEYLSTSAWARESKDKKGMDDSQQTGSCSSYARKYALNGLFAIDDTKDADNAKPDKTDSDPLGSKPVCVWCAKPIKDEEIEGKKYTAGQIASNTKRKYGVILHPGCVDKWKESQ